MNSNMNYKSEIANIADKSFTLRLDSARETAMLCVAENICADCSERDDIVCSSFLCDYAEFIANLIARTITEIQTRVN